MTYQEAFLLIASLEPEQAKFFLDLLTRLSKVEGQSFLEKIIVLLEKYEENIGKSPKKA
jgi:hypothetical protein